jgi:hypothetical protein
VGLGRGPGAGEGEGRVGRDSEGTAARRDGFSFELPTEVAADLLMEVQVVKDGQKCDADRYLGDLRGSAAYG